jgi:hypothetical protein
VETMVSEVDIFRCQGSVPSSAIFGNLGVSLKLQNRESAMQPLTMYLIHTTPQFSVIVDRLINLEWFGHMMVWNGFSEHSVSKKFTKLLEEGFE